MLTIFVHRNVLHHLHYTHVYRYLEYTDTWKTGFVQIPGKPVSRFLEKWRPSQLLVLRSSRSLLWIFKIHGYFIFFGKFLGPNRDQDDKADDPILSPSSLLV